MLKSDPDNLKLRTQNSALWPA